MSDPLSYLQKIKRSSFTENSSTRLPDINEKSSPTNAAPTDNELMLLMAKKITSLTATVESQRKNISFKEEKIRTLEERVIHLENELDSLRSNNFEDLKATATLQQEATAFPHVSRSLAHDGDHRRSGAHEKVHNGNSSQFSESSCFSFDFDALVKNIEELNLLAGEGTSTVRYTKNGAKFENLTPMKLTFFSNGLLLSDGSFRPFSDRSTRRFVLDILDGFFPSELQFLYPDGVPFEIVDKRKYVHKEAVDNATSDKGDSFMHVIKNGQSTLYEKYSSESLTGRFLDKLPKVVVRKGNLFNIRESIRSLIQDDQIEYISLESPKSQNADTDDSHGKLIRLKVKVEPGNLIFLLTLDTTEDIGTVMKMLNDEKWRFATSAADTITEYSLIRLHPFLHLDDPRKTLKECNLLVNTMLLLKATDGRS